MLAAGARALRMAFAFCINSMSHQRKLVVEALPKR